MPAAWPHASGVPACNVPLPAKVTTFAEHLPDECATAYMGKWHLGDASAGLAGAHGGYGDTTRRVKLIA